MSTTITICDTCKRQDWPERGIEQTDGERLAALIEKAAANVAGVKTRRHACLMGCDHGCNISIQANGKLTYVLGKFEPDQASAEGIVEYARNHAESESGQVPFRTWPQAIKGHFIARLPVLAENLDSE